MLSAGRETSERLGATPDADGRVRFRVGALARSSVAVRLESGEHALDQTGDGFWDAEAPAAAGDDYVYVLDGDEERPDPCSRLQPDGIPGVSRVVDTAAFAWTDDGWPGLDLDELVVYELHVGTVTKEGTFDAVIPYLRGLRELGVTAIVLMPVARFPGNRGWGYDGVYAFALRPAYGGLHGLARLVDAAHAEGVGVLLDVVYNHMGPGSEAIAAFGPNLTTRHETPWGDALDYEQAGVREWALQNACAWVRDYHVLLTGERQGHYARYGRMAQLAAAFERPEAARLVVCSQNPDQAGNRADGDRLTREELQVAACCTLLSPCTALLFQGEEYSEQRPFLFFTDHDDPAVAAATRRGGVQLRADFARLEAELSR